MISIPLIRALIMAAAYCMRVFGNHIPRCLCYRGCRHEKLIVITRTTVLVDVEMKQRQREPGNTPISPSFLLAALPSSASRLGVELSLYHEQKTQYQRLLE